jgi:hypothetical protein
MSVASLRARFSRKKGAESLPKTLAKPVEVGAGVFSLYARSAAADFASADVGAVKPNRSLAKKPQ